MQVFLVMNNVTTGLLSKDAKIIMKSLGTSVITDFKGKQPTMLLVQLEYFLQEDSWPIYLAPYKRFTD
jgi:hypothetical protein